MSITLVQSCTAPSRLSPSGPTAGPPQALSSYAEFRQAVPRSVFRLWYFQDEPRGTSITCADAVETKAKAKAASATERILQNDVFIKMLLISLSQSGNS